jgi:hypothetical protein
MTNEEYIEEILIVAHQQGVRDEILNQVDKVMKQNYSKSFYEVIHEVFYNLVREGKICY